MSADFFGPSVVVEHPTSSFFAAQGVERYLGKIDILSRNNSQIIL